MSATRRLVRSNSGAPSARSSALTASETDDWLMYSFSAARPKCSSLATARKQSSWRRSMRLIDRD
ncbi:Uncharacterised protein [Bordetella pertussis]|nr:Uncharacterised protein [Bordetella pertussis]